MQRDIRGWYKASFLGTVSCIILYTIYGLFFVRHHAITIASQMDLLLRSGMTPLIRPDDPYLHAFGHRLGSALFFGLTLGVLNALICMGLTLMAWSSGRMTHRDSLLLTAAALLCTFLGFSRELPVVSIVCGVLCPASFVLPWRWVLRKGRGAPVRMHRWLFLTGILCAPFILFLLMRPSFLMVRDSMIGMPVINVLSDFYYQHTLLAAHVVSPPATKDQKVIAVSQDIARIGPMPHGTLWIRIAEPCSQQAASFVVSRERLSCTSIILKDDLPANARGRIFMEYGKIFDYNEYMRLGVGTFLFSGPLIIVALLLVSWLGCGLESISHLSGAITCAFVVAYLTLFIPAWHTAYLGYQLRAHPEKIRTYVDSGDEKKRYLVAAAYPGSLSPAELTGMIQGKSARIRVNALIEAGQRRDPAFTPFMEGALADPQLNVRTKACWALGMIGSDRALLLLDKVVRDDPSWYVREYAYAALGKIRPEARVVSTDF